jgi:hypothetical protein
MRSEWPPVRTALTSALQTTVGRRLSWAGVRPRTPARLLGLRRRQRLSLGALARKLRVSIPWIHHHFKGASSGVWSRAPGIGGSLRALWAHQLPWVER